MVTYCIGKELKKMKHVYFLDRFSPTSPKRLKAAGLHSLSPHHECWTSKYGCPGPSNLEKEGSFDLLWRKCLQPWDPKNQENSSGCKRLLYLKSTFQWRSRPAKEPRDHIPIQKDPTSRETKQNKTGRVNRNEASSINCFQLPRIQYHIGPFWILWYINDTSWLLVFTPVSSFMTLSHMLKLDGGPSPLWLQS